MADKIHSKLDEKTLRVEVQTTEVHDYDITFLKEQKARLETSRSVN